jgi:hypothetical protein
LDTEKSSNALNLSALLMNTRTPDQQIFSKKSRAVAMNEVKEHCKKS